MDIHKIRKAKRSDRLEVFVSELLDRADNSPTVAIEIEHALRKLQSYYCYIESSHGGVTIAKRTVIFSEDDDGAMRRVSPKGYNAYEVLAAYLGLGDKEPASCETMRLLFPELITALSMELGTNAERFCYDFIVKQIIGVLRRQIVNQQGDKFVAIDNAAAARELEFAVNGS